MDLIAIGDIHGCARTLEALLERLAPTAGDDLVFVGDYVDRGPDSKGVLDRLIALSETHRCTFLRGNHEALMLEYVEEGVYDLWGANGGIATLSSYVGTARQVQIPPAHLAFIRDTVLYHNTPDFFFVHAGLRAGMTIQENLRCGGEDVFLWERSHLGVSDQQLAWEKTVVCGHTPRAEPINRPRLIGIDTGCVYHTHPRMGRLTAVRLPEREFISVPYQG